MRVLKSICKAILTLFIIVFVNGCIYVFALQEKTMDKIKKGEEPSLYEKCSIYTMHMAVYMFGWPLSPEAAGEVFRMSFPWNRETAILREDDFFIESPTTESPLPSIPAIYTRKMERCISSHMHPYTMTWWCNNADW